MIGSISKIRPAGHHHYYKYAHAENYKDLYCVCNRNTEYRNDLEPDGELKFIFQNFKNWGGGNICDSGSWGQITKIDNNFPNVTGRWSHAWDAACPTLKYLNLDCPNVTIAHAFLYSGNGSLSQIKTLYLKLDNTFDISSFMPRAYLHDDPEREIKIYIPKCKNISSMFGQVGNSWTRVNLQNTKFEFYAPLVTNGNDAFAGTKISELSYPIDEDGNWTFLSNKQSVGKKYCVFDKLESGTNLFYNCLLSKDFSINFLEKLPSYTSGTHELLMGIHIDHKYDPEVNVALKKICNSYITPIEEYGAALPETIITDKGWTLTVQWNGTKTSNAYPEPS